MLAVVFFMEIEKFFFFSPISPLPDLTSLRISLDFCLRKGAPMKNQRNHPTGGRSAFFFWFVSNRYAQEKGPIENTERSTDL